MTGNFRENKLCDPQGIGWQQARALYSVNVVVGMTSHLKDVWWISLLSSTRFICVRWL